MKKLKILAASLLLCFSSFAQNDTIYYLGVNGQLKPEGLPEIKKEIDYRGKGDVTVTTWKRTNEGWKEVYVEKINRVNQNQFSIKIKGDKFTEEVVRRFEEQNDGKLKFTDWVDNEIRRTGYSLSRIPLVFDGEVTEFYENGNKKSVSLYKKNRLVSSENWLESGEKYVDNIFYSVEREPRYQPGMKVLHHYLMEAFKKSQVDLSKTNGQIVVGFVVMEDGSIDGVQIEEGLNWQLNSVAVNAFQSLPGTWQPARIGDQDVRFYQLFPINFIHHNYDLEYLDLRGSMLYWEIN